MRLKDNIMQINNWNHIKDTQPLAGALIQIQHDKGILDCAATKATVYNEKNNLVLRYDQFEIWRNKEETGKS